MNDNGKDITITMLSGQVINMAVGLDIKYVYKVVSLPYLEPIPGSPDYLVGLMNLAGETIPVIDIALKLEMKRQQKYTLNTPIVIVELKNTKIAMLIDTVNEIIHVNQSEINHHDLNNTMKQFSTIIVNNAFIHIIDMSYLDFMLKEVGLYYLGDKKKETV